MKRISVLIPAYRGDDNLRKLIYEVLSDPYPDKEIVVVVDQPVEETVMFAEKLRNKVGFIFNERRVGKAKALNQAIEISTGEILLFLDADTQLGIKNFLKTVVDELKGYDVLDVKKVVKARSFLQRMIQYEYLGFNVASWILSKRLERVPGINGACFAATREIIRKVGGIPYTISEDLDLALRITRIGGRFKYTSKAFVYTEAPKTWEEWSRQRKRWAIGLGYWLKDNLRLLVNEFLKSPLKYISSIVLIFPSLIAGFVAAILGEPLFLLLQMFLLSSLLPIPPTLRLLGLAFIPGSTNEIMVYLFSLGAGFGTGWLVFKKLSKKLGYKFSSKEFLAYILVYSPLWLALTVYGIIVAMVGKDLKIDWVVERS